MRTAAGLAIALVLAVGCSSGHKAQPAPAAVTIEMDVHAVQYGGIERSEVGLRTCSASATVVPTSFLLPGATLMLKRSDGTTIGITAVGKGKVVQSGSSPGDPFVCEWRWKFNHAGPGPFVLETTSGSRNITRSENHGGIVQLSIDQTAS